ncbi:hypothetical protein QBC45DRAFT_399391 [Copromyces sp. CBS 386.78]|nr:hypothetical protein QBC45DRAFT_399391 [Copromyces sp. CBS 386.78]
MPDHSSSNHRIIYPKTSSQRPRHAKANMAPNTKPQADFYCLWKDETIRERLFDLLDKGDLCAVRATNSALSSLLTKRLFLRTHLTFTANTFTKQTRICALSRIGHHIEHLTFSFPHSDATFLPPLIHPTTGHEISFLYHPITSMAAALFRPKFTSSELGQILTEQYPPLFHAASNVPSFINAMRHLPNMRHLTIKTPGQDPKERYRRDCVDYALISLRISLERAPLTKLSKLSLSGVHPTAFNYLRHTPGSGYGVSPSAERRWRQIRKLYISVESWDFYHPDSPGLDHLKIMDEFIRWFAPRLEKFSFTWDGHRKGPCPIALGEDPLFAPAGGKRQHKKLSNESTDSMSPLPERPRRREMDMPRLKYLSVRNATMNASQVNGLVKRHMRTVKEFQFEEVLLVGEGTWDEALKPLFDEEERRAKSGKKGDIWCRRSISGSVESGSVMRQGQRRQMSGLSSTTDGCETLLTESSAATPMTTELLNADLETVLVNGGWLEDGVDALEVGVQEWAKGVSAAASSGLTTNTVIHDDGGADKRGSGTITTIREEGEEEVDVADLQMGTNMSVSTRIKKQRLRKKSSGKHRRGDDSITEEEEASESRRRDRERREHASDDERRHHSTEKEKDKGRHSRSKTKYSRRDESSDRHRSRSRSRHGTKHHRHHRREYPEDDPVTTLPTLPELKTLSEVNGADDEDLPQSPQPKNVPYTPPQLVTQRLPPSPPQSAGGASNKDKALPPPPPGYSSPTPPRSPPRMTEQDHRPSPRPSLDAPQAARLNITAPILNANPFPAVLSPTVYDPSSKTSPLLGISGPQNARGGAVGTLLFRDSTSSNPDGPSLFADLEAHVESEQDRAAALKKAREQVLEKLSKEFAHGPYGTPSARDSVDQPPPQPMARPQPPKRSNSHSIKSQIPSPFPLKRANSHNNHQTGTSTGHRRKHSGHHGHDSPAVMAALNASRARPSAAESAPTSAVTGDRDHEDMLAFSVPYHHHHADCGITCALATVPPPPHHNSATSSSLGLGARLKEGLFGIVRAGTPGFSRHGTPGPSRTGTPGISHMAGTETVVHRGRMSEDDGGRRHRERDCRERREERRDERSREEHRDQHGYKYGHGGLESSAGGTRSKGTSGTGSAYVPLMISSSVLGHKGN